MRWWWYNSPRYRQYCGIYNNKFTMATHGKKIHKLYWFVALKKWRDDMRNRWDGNVLHTYMSDIWIFIWFKLSYLWMPSGLYTKHFLLALIISVRLINMNWMVFYFDFLDICLHCIEIEIIQTICILWCISRIRTNITVIYCVYNQWK